MIQTFDERREIHRLLRHLSEPERIDWLQWCCRQVSHGASVETRVIQSNGSVQDVFNDALSLKFIHGLSLEAMGLELVRRVRRKGASC